jgi:hypothetical protein
MLGYPYIPNLLRLLYLTKLIEYKWVMYCPITRLSPRGSSGQQRGWIKISNLGLEGRDLKAHIQTEEDVWKQASMSLYFEDSIKFQHLKKFV